MLSCTKINYVAHLLLLVLNEHFPSFLTDSSPAVVHRKEVKIRIILYTLLACWLSAWGEFVAFVELLRSQ